MLIVPPTPKRTVGLGTLGTMLESYLPNTSCWFPLPTHCGLQGSHVTGSRGQPPSNAQNKIPSLFPLVHQRIICSYLTNHWSERRMPKFVNYESHMQNWSVWAFITVKIPERTHLERFLLAHCFRELNPSSDKVCLHHDSQGGGGERERDEGERVLCLWL